MCHRVNYWFCVYLIHGLNWWHTCVLDRLFLNFEILVTCSFKSYWVGSKELWTESIQGERGLYFSSSYCRCASFHKLLLRVEGAIQNSMGYIANTNTNIKMSDYITLTRSVYYWGHLVGDKNTLLRTLHGLTDLLSNRFLWRGYKLSWLIRAYQLADLANGENLLLTREKLTKIDHLLLQTTSCL